MTETWFSALIVFCRLRVPDDDVGVGAGQDRALARIEVEDARDVGRGDGDEFVRRQAAGADAVGPQHRHAVFEAAGAVRDLGEVGEAEFLLFGRERAMVGRDHLQRAGAQAVPEIVLVLLVAERRAHHAPRRVLPVLVVIFALVEHEMLDQRLAVDAHAVRRARAGSPRAPRCRRCGRYRSARPPDRRARSRGWSPRPRLPADATARGPRGR